MACYSKLLPLTSSDLSVKQTYNVPFQKGMKIDTQRCPSLQVTMIVTGIPYITIFLLVNEGERADEAQEINGQDNDGLSFQIITLNKF